MDDLKHFDPIIDDINEQTEIIRQIEKKLGLRCKVCGSSIIPQKDYQCTRCLAEEMNL